MKISEKIRVINGDCSEVIKTLDLSKAIIVSDPPFNMRYHYNIYKDNKTDIEYDNMIKSIFNSSTPHVMIHYAEYLHKHSLNINKIPEKIISWVYNSNTAKQHRQIGFYGVKPDFRKVGQPYKNPNDKRIIERIKLGKMARLYDWWNINQVKNVSKEKTIHPCQMPQEVVDNIIGILPEDYTIIDPFMGSGTTALACIKYDRNFIGIEIDDLYFKLCVDRIKDTLI